MHSVIWTVMRRSLGGLKRRDFLKFCTGVAATLGLSPSLGMRIAEAATAGSRPPVIWLSAQECTGCTELLLRAHHPTVESLILDMISLDYHETLCAGAGQQAEAFKAESIKKNWGKYVLVVDGSIPTRDGGIYCMIGGRPILDIVKETAEGAAAILAIGSCASWGGIPASDPNPTQARPVHEILPGKTVINIPGCPPNVYNFLSTVLYLVTFGKPPELDDKNRPKFAYGRLIHENCERRPHFDAGRFALEFGDQGHREGWCLYKLGCKGPETYANCPAILFGDVGSGAWPVGTGHPCFGCTEQGVGFHQADPLPRQSADGHATDGISAGRRTEGSGSDARRGGVGGGGGRCRDRRRRGARDAPGQARRRREGVRTANIR